MDSMDGYRRRISDCGKLSSVELLMRELKGLRHEGRLEGRDFKELKEQAKRKMRELGKKPHEPLA